MLTVRVVAGRRVSQQRIVIARLVAVTASMQGKTGTMTGDFKLTATWAGLILKQAIPPFESRLNGRDRPDGALARLWGR